MASVSPDSSAVAAHAARAGGRADIGAVVPRRPGSRSVMTNVPAKMSPRRLPPDDSSEVSSAMKPSVSHISSTPARARISAWRNRSGPPSSLTTRSPRASLPSDRPRLRVSNSVG